MIKEGERRVVTHPFEYDEIYFEEGVEFVVSISDPSRYEYGCVFDTYYYDMHSLRYCDEERATYGHGYWIDKHEVIAHTMPATFSGTPDWEL